MLSLHRRSFGLLSSNEALAFGPELLVERCFACFPACTYSRLSAGALCNKHRQLFDA
jgi:hypothetical protein